MLATADDTNNKCFTFKNNTEKNNLQNQNENDEQVNTMYIGNEDVKAAVEKLKAELSQARLVTTQTIDYSNGIEETIEANQIETSSNKDENFVLEHQENKPSMDC